jgi:hypothetical protein
MIRLAGVVTNALAHGAGSITLCVELSATLRVEVSDQGDGGWGLLIVETSDRPLGYRGRQLAVWFEMDLK